MKATELRIGNLVNHISFGIVELNGILNNTLKCNYNNDEYWDNLGFYKPIPLTEEWLVKFGFYKNIDTELFEKSGFQIDFSVIKCHFYLPDYGDWYKEIEFVHELQNIFFCLTGEELTIKQDQ